MYPKRLGSSGPGLLSQGACAKNPLDGRFGSHTPPPPQKKKNLHFSARGGGLVINAFKATHNTYSAAWQVTTLQMPSGQGKKEGHPFLVG